MDVVCLVSYSSSLITRMYANRVGGFVSEPICWHILRDELAWPAKVCCYHDIPMPIYPNAWRSRTDTCIQLGIRALVIRSAQYDQNGLVTQYVPLMQSDSRVDP